MSETPGARETHGWLDRVRATFKRQVVWPVGERAVRTRAWDLGLAGYTVAAMELGPGGRTDASPLTLRWIDPDRTVYDALPERPEWPPVGCVVGGDWDLIEDRFEKRHVPRAIRQRFVEGREWTETPLPDHVHDQVDRFGDAWGYAEDAVSHRCGEVEALYRAMQAQGYLTQNELAARAREDAGPGPPPVPALGEITVDIGRRGHLCWRGNGQHRLAIARVLGIDRVPVLIARRHTVWQETRNRVRTDGFDAATEDTAGIEIPLRAHPDLRDL